MGEPWAPGLPDVARHIPTRTRDTKTPGSDRLLNTFTASTTPTDAQAQQVIDDITAVLEARVGDLPNILAAKPDVATAARVWVEWRAAADIEIAYFERDAQVAVYPQLNQRANEAWAEFLEALEIGDMGAIAADPVWAMPAPPPWGDQSPGSGVIYQAGPV